MDNHKGPMVGEHPPRLRADAAEDPWHEDYRWHPERWVGAELAHRAKGAANLESAVGIADRAAGRFG